MADGMEEIRSTTPYLPEEQLLSKEPTNTYYFNVLCESIRSVASSLLESDDVIWEVFELFVKVRNAIGNDDEFRSLIGSLANDLAFIISQITPLCGGVLVHEGHQHRVHDGINRVRTSDGHVIRFALSSNGTRSYLDMFGIVTHTIDDSESFRPDAEIDDWFSQFFRSFLKSVDSRDYRRSYVTYRNAQHAAKPIIIKSVTCESADSKLIDRFNQLRVSL